MSIPYSKCSYVPYEHLISHLKAFPNLEYLNVRCEFQHIKTIFEYFPSIQLDWNLYEFHSPIRLVKKDMCEPWFEIVRNDTWVSKHDPGHWLPQYGWEEASFLHPNDLSIEDWQNLAVKYLKKRLANKSYMIYHPPPFSIQYKKTPHNVKIDRFFAK